MLLSQLAERPELLLVLLGDGDQALEALVDLASPDYHPLAKSAKDIAAAAVLVGALGAVVVGLLILGPPLFEKIFG